MRRATALLTAATAAALLAGCSPSSPEAIEAAGITDERAEDPVVPTGPGGEIYIESGDPFFANLRGTPVDGPVAVTLNNIGDAEHNFRIDNASGDNVKVEALGGEENVGDLLLFGQPGGLEYTYYCDIPGHRAAGMEGTLVVYGSADEVEDGTDLGTVTDGPVVAGGDGNTDMTAETDDAAEESADETAEESAEESTDETSEETTADESTDESDA